MNFERIGASHPLFEASFTLYEASFPPNERRTREDHLRALQDADFFPLGAVEDGKLLADVFLWERTSAILSILLFSRLCAATGLAARFSGSC